VLGLLIPIGRGVGDVLFLNALNERITSAFRATVMSMVQLGTRASFALLGPLVGYAIDGWGLPSVLSALGVLFSIAFVFLLLPLVLREMPGARAEAASPCPWRAALSGWSPHAWCCAGWRRTPCRSTHASTRCPRSPSISTPAAGRARPTRRPDGC